MEKILMIDGHNIYNYFMSGARKIIYNERDLNSINVFPVADGDTGTNLALTMRVVLQNSKKDKNISKTLTSISEVATENAYGNSGMIFAEYLNGFAREAKSKTEINLLEFIDIAEKASEYAYNAVASPKEGTILSVMREWSSELRTLIHISNFETILDESINKVRILVEKTKYQLKVLSDNNVVDAGAKAFLFFLEGIHEFINKGEVLDIYEVENVQLDNHENFIPVNQDIEHRYCTQFYIESNRSKKEYQEKLMSLGDSLVITGNDRRYKIHIHTNYPDKVLNLISDDNKILSQKIEDMKLMNSIIHNKKAKIGIVTDSIADIPQSIIDEEQITVIPLNLICDSIVYLDKITMRPEEFYQKLNQYKMNPTSAQPSVRVMEKTFSMLLNHYDSIIGIFVSQKMSGTYNNAAKVAKKLSEEGKKITAIDSKLNSAAQGLLILEAVNLLKKGLNHDDIVSELNRVKENIRIFVSVDDLSSMIKGGRIPKRLGFILKLVKLKPVVSIDKKGNGMVYKKTFSKKSAVDKILNRVKTDLKNEGIKNYSLVYSDADSKGDIGILESRLKNILNKDPDYIAPISAVVGLNAGKGCVAVAYVKGSA